jgi:hypothetical protein
MATVNVSLDQLRPAAAVPVPPSTADVNPSDLRAAGPAIPPRASDALPQPDEVDRHTTAIAQAFVAPPVIPGYGPAPGAPAPPALPVPWETDLQTTNPPDHAPGLITGKDQTDIPQWLLNHAYHGVGRLASGVEQMAAPGVKNKFGAAHEVAAGAFEAATPAMLGAGAAAPAKTAVQVAATSVSQEAVQAGLERLGLPKEYASVAGDAVALLLGHYSGKAAEMVKEQIGPVLRKKFIEEKKYNASVGVTSVPVSELSVPPKETTNAETKVERPAQGKPVTVTQPGQPAAAGGSAAVPAATDAAAGQAAGAETAVEPKLPRELAGGKPRYKGFTLDFESDLDKAAYISAQEKTSKADRQYVDFVARHTGRTEAEIRAGGGTVRSTIKGLATNAEPGALRVPSHQRQLWNRRTLEADAAAPATQTAVDSGAARPVDAARVGEGGGDHGPGAAGARQIPGEDTDITVPGEDRSIRARYEVRELADLQPSHNGQTFLPNPKYPYRNERDYSKPENQGRVIQQSSEEKFNPRFHITDNPDATNGPTLTDEDGNAFGGNSRLMHLQRVYGRDASAAAGYRALLEKKAAQFGIDPAAVREMKQPVLVRAASNAELASLPGGHKWAIRNTNVSGVAALSASERSAADAQQLHPDMVQHIANAIEDAGPDATLNDALAGKNGPALGNRLIHEGFFKEQERAELMDGKTGALTQLAKDRIGKAMLGKFFRDSDQIARTPASIRNKLERIAAPLAKLAGNQEFDIRADISDAIDAMEYKQAQGFSSYEDASSQHGMFGDANPVTPRSAYFARMLEEFTQNELTAIMRKYAINSVPEEGMFGSYNPTPKQAMADSVKAIVDDQEAAALKKIDTKMKGVKEGGAPWEAFNEERAATSARFGAKQQDLAQRAEAAYAVERPKAENSAVAPPPATPPDPAAAGPSTGAETAPPAPAAPDAGEAKPPAPPTYMGSGLGALQPLFDRATAEGDALKARRDEALAAAKKAADTPAEKSAGEKVRAYFTAERDLWAARTNQAIDIVTRKLLTKIQDREALGIAREFRHQPLELQAFIDGSHPFLQDVDGGAAQAYKNLNEPLGGPFERKRTVMDLLRQAQRILSKPTARERAADAAFTNIAERDLQEGRAGGWLESRWQSDQYVPHALNAKGEGEVAKAPSTEGKMMGQVGKWFGFGERRSDRYPTMVHAVADGLIPKTLDPSAAFTVHADQFARARATHLLEAHLADSGLGKWGDGTNAPVGWKQLAAHTEEFKKRQAFAVPNSYDPETGESELRVGTTGLYVPAFVEKAMSAITDPDFGVKYPGFAKLRTAQRGLKEAILGLSGFHLLTENFMAAADIGPAGMLRAFQADRQAAGFLTDERDLIGAGGTTSIQGSTMDAYRGLRPGTIPTRAEVVRAYIPGSKQALQLADSITRFTFDNIQRRFKVQAFALHRDAWMKDNPMATPDQAAEAKKGIASYVNGVYGGLHWENMGISRMAVEAGRAIFLAPDWSGSNIALAKYALADSRPSARELPFGRTMAGAATKESAQARLSRAFWTKQLVGGLVTTQMLSLTFSGKLSPRPFQVYLGDDKNGEGVYQNVAFRGSIGDAVSLVGKMEDHGALVGFGTFVGGKAAPIMKLGIHALTGRDDFGREIAPKDGGFLKNTGRSTVALGGDALPIPIIVRTVHKTLFGDEADRYLWSERVLSMFGPLAQHVAPEGMRLVNGELVEKRYREPRQPRAK